MNQRLLANLMISTLKVHLVIPGALGLFTEIFRIKLLSIYANDHY